MSFYLLTSQIKCKNHYICHQILFLKDIRTVLCVDDDPDEREIVCTAISEIDTNFKVFYAENGLEAHSYLSEAKSTGDFPCLIILDINMPVMDGKETLVALKKDDQVSKIPVAMFTTSSSPSDKQFFSDFGVDLVTKPADLSSIVFEVRKLLSYCA